MDLCRSLTKFKPFEFLHKVREGIKRELRSNRSFVRYLDDDYEKTRP